MSKAIVSIPNFRPEQDIIHICDDRYSLIYKAIVRTAAGEEEHLIVCTLPHSIGQEERDAINRNLRETNAGATISFHVADRDGWAQVITGPDEELNHFNLAAAIAVIKRSCRWDESLPIVVGINGAEIRLWPRFDGQHWVVEDRKETNCEGLS